MKERVFFEAGTRLSLVTGAGEKAREWTILGLVGAGSTTICYTAESGGVRGRLKVFDPADGFGFPEQAMKEYQKAYERLRRLKAENEDAALLNNYMPPSQLLFRFDEEGKMRGLFVWTPEDKAGSRFDTYIQAVREDPETMPEHKLFNILGVLSTLADFLRVLQDLGYTHLDIKPSNFLVTYDGAFDINPASISLFDIDSIWKMDEVLPAARGTKGFRAPELAMGRPGQFSAVYSLGAILYHALAPLGEKEGDYYQDWSYGKIPEFVDASPLIRASEINSSDTVRYLLVRILRNCLHRRPLERYPDLESLMEDIARIRGCMLREKGAQGPGAQNELDGDVLEGGTPDLMILDLLWRYPMTDYVPEGEKEMKILVLGQDAAARRFADLALQMAQTPGIMPRLTLLCEDPDLVRSAYLERRPALERFISVDGPGRDKCGRLDFGELPCWLRTEEDDCPGDRIAGFLEEGGWRYVFLSLGDENLSRLQALRIREAAEGAGIRLLAAYPSVREERIGEEERAGAVSVRPGLSRVDPDLERIAFHVHLTWAQVNADPEEAWKEFRQPYEYISSMSFAAALPYRLWSAGIGRDLYRKDPGKAAGLYQTRVLADQGEGSLYRDLIWTEHRRWCLEKACSGWNAPLVKGKLDYAYPIRHHAVRDMDTRIQMCLIPSTREMPLISPAYTESRERWDQPGPYDDELDPLDRMSVEIHRRFVKEAEDFIRRNSLEEEELAVIRSRLTGAPASVQGAFEQYLFCIRSILEGNLVYVRGHKRFRDALLDLVREETPYYYEDIRYRMERIEEALFAVRESFMYRDYKLNDKVLIDQIPFLLTRKTDLVMAAPLDWDGGRGLIRTAASAMVLNPERFLCPVWVGRDRRAKDLISAMESLSDAFLSRGLRSRIVFRLFLDHALEEKERQNLLSYENDQFQVTDAGSYESGRDAAMAAGDLLGRAGVSFLDLTPAMFEDADSQALLGDAVPCFAWREDASSFRNLKGCPEIEYYSAGTFLRVRDMNVLFGSGMKETGMPPMSSELEPLRKIAYRTGHGRFALLQRKLADHIGRDDLVREVLFVPDAEAFRTEMKIPASQASVARAMLDFLSGQGLVTDYQVWNITGDICRVTAEGTCPIKTCIGSLRSYRREDLTERTLRPACVREEDGRVRIRILFDSMEVSALPVPEEDLKRTLRDLEKEDFLYDLTFNGDLASFRFMGACVRQVLLTPGLLEQTFMARDLWMTGWFDDMGCGEIREGSRTLPAAVFIRGFCMARAVFEEESVRITGFSPVQSREEEPVRIPYGEAFCQQAEKAVRAMLGERRKDDD